jgi:class 3 adenylate cyclase/tetratricopeptide (TPR) repeat protein
VEILVTDIRDWLKSLGLAEYAPVFIDNEVDVAALPYLTESMLKELGFSIGVRAKLMAAIEALRPTTDVGEPAFLEEAGTSAKIRFEPTTRAAERRHLTVMFCDLVGSTALAEAMDPEDLRALIGRYQSAARMVVERYEGNVAQYLGDGIMVYFGWPIAHEDDAERAVRAALELVRQVKSVEAPASIQVRIGIATGLVVIGEGEDGAPQLAVGETPNLAARLQTLAGDDEIVIGETTRVLLGGAFDLVDIGSHCLKGFAQPVRAMLVDGLARTDGRFAARSQRLIPFVGRDPELAILLDRWANSKEGEGQVVLVEGEPGFGKSRLVHEFTSRIKSDQRAEVRYQCSPYYSSSALHPVIEYLERVAGFEANDSGESRLNKLEAVVPDNGQQRALFASLLSLDTHRYPRLDVSPQKLKDLTLQALANRLEEITEKGPVLLIVEDAHWLDPTTQEALDLQLSGLGDMPVMAIVTFRPEYKSPWSGLSFVTPLRLTRLGKRQARQMVDTLGPELSDETRAQIVTRAEGNPLFVEEMANAVRSGAAFSRAGTDALSIPSTLHDSLTARLDRLGPVKEVAQTAACIGRHFSRTLLGEIKAMTEQELDGALSSLVESGLVYPERMGDGQSFAFKHVLIQQAAYDSLLNSTRRKIHSAIASVLIARQDLVQRSDPLLIAQHLQNAQRLRESLPWLEKAAFRTANSGSILESMEILGNALSLLEEMELTTEERAQIEFKLLIAQLPACIAVNGWASEDADAICERALELAVSLNDKSLESSILFQRAAMHEVRGEFSKTQEVLARRHLILPKPADPEPVVESSELMACSTFHQGCLDNAIQYASEALRHADPMKHTELGATLFEDPTVACLFWIAKSLLLQGKVDQARRRHREAFECVRGAPNWYSESQAHIDAATLLAYQRDFEAAREHAEQAAFSSERVGLAYRQASASVIREWADAEIGDRMPDLERLRASMNVFKQTGAMIGYAFFLGLSAEIHTRIGEHEQSEALISEALKVCGPKRGYFFEGELHRLAGNVKRSLARADYQTEAEASYQRALQIAAGQGALLFELRAANAQAQLWLEQGKREKARELLVPLFSQFEEGFDSTDLVEASSLLKALG